MLGDTEGWRVATYTGARLVLVHPFKGEALSLQAEQAPIVTTCMMRLPLPSILSNVWVMSTLFQKPKS